MFSGVRLQPYLSYHHVETDSRDLAVYSRVTAVSDDDTGMACQARPEPEPPKPEHAAPTPLHHLHAALAVPTPIHHLHTRSSWLGVGLRSERCAPPHMDPRSPDPASAHSQFRSWVSQRNTSVKRLHTLCGISSLDGGGGCPITASSRLAGLQHRQRVSHLVHQTHHMIDTTHSTSYFRCTYKVADQF